MRVPEFVLKCVAFIGEVQHEDSSGFSGELCATGFFVTAPSETFPENTYTYFVTAKHVPDDLKGKNAYILVNKKGGGTTTDVRLVNNMLYHHPTDRTADVAVAAVVPGTEADIVGISSSDFITPDLLKNQNPIGIGDETVITGLFIPASGGQQNMPILRHGNVAMMPNEPIETDLGYADVYLVEARSIGGVSGSPIFVRQTLKLEMQQGSGEPKSLITGLGKAWLLGLMHGHWDIKESEMNKAYFKNDRKHGVNLGISIAVPAVKILETINNHPALVELREKNDRLLEEDRRTRIAGNDI